MSRLREQPEPAMARTISAAAAMGRRGIIVPRDVKGRVSRGVIDAGPCTASVSRMGPHLWCLCHRALVNRLRTWNLAPTIAISSREQGVRTRVALRSVEFSQDGHG